MCATAAPGFQALMLNAHGNGDAMPTDGSTSGAAAADSGNGSRRRKLWELDGHAHCPVLGVCMPLALQRKLVSRASGQPAIADDYELHCSTVADCKYRNKVSELIQRELDDRYRLAVAQAAKLKTTEALGQWWSDAFARRDIAGPFWATLTHPRCSGELARKAEGQVHMLQHQVGMAARVDADRFDEALLENRRLARDLAAAQHRHAEQADQHARQIDLLNGLVMQMRAQLLAKDTLTAGLQAELQALAEAVPGLRQRRQLSEEVQRLTGARQALLRSLDDAREATQRQRTRADRLQQQLSDLQQVLEQDSEAEGRPPADATPPDVELGNRAVLCVGGRSSAVPIYRQWVEQTGGRFLHHDGGAEDSDARLEATLSAADMVICQAGCISHNAYWRVKDHCKRTGKRCIFVRQPSSAGIQRALQSLQPSTAGHTQSS